MVVMVLAKILAKPVAGVARAKTKIALKSMIMAKKARKAKPMAGVARRPKKPNQVLLKESRADGLPERRRDTSVALKELPTIEVDGGTKS